MLKFLLQKENSLCKNITHHNIQCKMLNFTTVLCEFLLLVSICNHHRISCEDFSYEGENGPEHWGEHYAACSGSKQSPINIETEKVEKKMFPPLQYHGFENDIESVIAESNTHTVIVHMKNGNRPTVKGGPLNAEYEFNQFHFHWGPDNTVGSEHQIDGKTYSLEMHLVMGLKESEHTTANGVAVLAFFGGVYYKSMIADKGLHQVFGTLGREKQLKALFIIFQTAVRTSGSIQLDNLRNIGSLNNLTIIERDSYFTYDGSLTTPPCTEAVTWIIFEDIMPVDRSMLKLLRSLPNGANGNLTRTYRPIQPLNNRKIYRGSSTSEYRGSSTAELGNVMYVAIAMVTSAYWHS